MLPVADADVCCVDWSADFVGEVDFVLEAGPGGCAPGTAVAGAQLEISKTTKTTTTMFFILSFFDIRENYFRSRMS